MKSSIATRIENLEEEDFLSTFSSFINMELFWLNFRLENLIIMNFPSASSTFILIFVNFRNSFGIYHWNRTNDNLIVKRARPFAAMLGKRYALRRGKNVQRKSFPPFHVWNGWAEEKASEKSQYFLSPFSWWW